MSLTAARKERQRHAIHRVCAICSTVNSCLWRKLGTGYMCNKCGCKVRRRKLKTAVQEWRRQTEAATSLVPVAAAPEGSTLVPAPEPFDWHKAAAAAAAAAPASAQQTSPAPPPPAEPSSCFADMVKAWQLSQSQSLLPPALAQHASQVLASAGTQASTVSEEFNAALEKLGLLRNSGTFVAPSQQSSQVQASQSNTAPCPLAAATLFSLSRSGSLDQPAAGGGAAASTPAALTGLQRVASADASHRQQHQQQQHQQQQHQQQQGLGPDVSALVQALRLVPGLAQAPPPPPPPPPPSPAQTLSALLSALQPQPQAPAPVFSFQLSHKAMAHRQAAATAAAAALLLQAYQGKSVAPPPPQPQQQQRMGASPSALVAELLRSSAAPGLLQQHQLRSALQAQPVLQQQQQPSAQALAQALLLHRSVRAPTGKLSMEPSSPPPAPGSTILHAADSGVAIKHMD